MNGLNRRQFIAGAAAMAGVAAFGAHAAEPIILGEGAHRYECLHDWGTLPPNIIYGITHGVAVDARGFVHVLHTSNKASPCKDTVVVFAPDGSFVRSWGEQFFGTAHGFDLIVEGGQEVFYVTDLARGLYKTTLDGKVIWHVDKPPFYADKPQLKYRPSNVAVAPNGDVYFSDGYGSWFIHHYDKDGNYKRTFGGDGADERATIHPHGLFVDLRPTKAGKEPLLVVAENDPKGEKPGRLHAFNLDGQHHGYLPTPVRSPRHFDQQGELVVVPDLDAIVTLIDGDNRVVAQLGDGWTNKKDVRTLRTRPRTEFKPGKFVCPHDAAFDKDGSIFIGEWVEVGRVTKLKKLA